jgi:predicted alpha/beta hydrolase family esterase
MDFYVGHSLGGFMLQFAMYENKTLQPKGIVILACPGAVSDFVEHYSGLMGLSENFLLNLQNEFIDQVDHPVEYFTTDRFSKALSSRGLIVHDKGDKEAPYFYAEQLHKNWAQSELVTMEGLGHKLKSPVVVERVIQFLEEKDVSFNDVS